MFRYRKNGTVSDDSYQMLDMIEVEVNRDADILGRVNPRSHFSDVVGKKVGEQLPLADFCCRCRCRSGRCVASYTTALLWAALYWYGDTELT